MIGEPAPADAAGTPLARKLGIRAGDALALLGAPDDLLQHSLRPLPDGVTVRRSGRAKADVTVAFFRDRRVLARRMPVLAAALAPGCVLWIAWPKRTSGMASDLGDQVVRELGLKTGLVDNKVCAIDAVWSGLRFVHRRA
jgi:hypothetical protein